jgi:2-C-methyl-D-erythritol 4-phosphate cytidylyltransferase
VLAAGSSSRFAAGAPTGSAPKQYETLHGRRVIDWALDQARRSCDGVVLAVAADRRDDPEPLADHVVVGGAERADSVRAALAAVPHDAEIVVVHDAARPLAGAALYESVIAAVRSGADGAIPGLPVSDTIKRVADGRVVETLPRHELVAVQTPQAFRASTLRAAHASGADATDDAALVEAIGGAVVVVPGEPANLKITNPQDLRVASLHLG